MYIEKITKHGQVNEGDLLLIMTDSGSIISEKARKVLNGGTADEEVVVALRSNRYFITSMVIAGKSWAMDVHIVRSKQIYTHVAINGAAGVRSPLEALAS